MMKMKKGSDHISQLKSTKFKQELQALKVLKQAKLINDRNLYLSVVSARIKRSKLVKNVKVKYRRTKYRWYESRTRSILQDFWMRTKIFYGLLQWVNVYSVTREYGGPEEGGWWYDNYELIDARICLRKNTVSRAFNLRNEYRSLEYGNISSVLGGRKITVWVENRKGESETTERPYYC